MHNHSYQPIGIFDSGLGGLTVAHAVTRLLPQESIVYFGDTAHAPWGDKAVATIQAYSIKICDKLLHQGCKIVLIACHTASAVAYELIKAYVDQQAIVVDIIDPMINHLHTHYTNKTMGLIGSTRTIQSNSYQMKLEALGVNIRLKTLATPLLAPLIEAGFIDHAITNQVIYEYLSRPDLHNIEGLILACTHYPLVKACIQNFYQANIAVIDPAGILAQQVQQILTQHNLNNRNTPATKKIYVSEYSEAFMAHAKLFFSDAVQLEKCPL